MADTVFSVLCALALKYVGAEGLDQVVAVCGDHLSDQGRRLTTALRDSNERAWKALEIALAGETLWNRLDRAEDRAFRQQLAAYLKQASIPELQDKEPFRKKCLQDLRQARKQALLDGRLSPEDLARRLGPLADRADPQAVLAAEKQALNDIAAGFKEAKLDALAWLLGQQPQPGQSVLVVAVRLLLPAPGRAGRGAGPPAPVHGDGGPHGVAAAGLPSARRRPEGARRPRRGGGRRPGGGGGRDPRGGPRFAGGNGEDAGREPRVLRPRPAHAGGTADAPAAGPRRRQPVDPLRPRTPEGQGVPGPVPADAGGREAGRPRLAQRPGQAPGGGRRLPQRPGGVHARRRPVAGRRLVRRGPLQRLPRRPGTGGGRRRRLRGGPGGIGGGRPLRPGPLRPVSAGRV